MNSIDNSKMQAIQGGTLNEAVAVACGVVAVADTAWYFGLINPAYGVALVAANLACAGYGIAVS